MIELTKNEFNQIKSICSLKHTNTKRKCLLYGVGDVTLQQL